jgi:hypothetical protein
MRQVREILRMKHEAGLPVREIVRRTGIPRRTVRELLERCAARGLGWPIAPEVSEAELEGLMFKEAGAKAGGRRRHEPDWRLVHKELKRKHVTLQILWDEYIEQHPEGYRYSRFCEIYREWEAKLSLSMRQTYLGIKDRYSELTDPSEAFELAELEYQRADVAEMKATFDFAKLDDQTKLSWRLAEYELERAEAEWPYRDHEYTFNQMFGVQSGIPAFLINQHKVTGASDAEAYIARLEGVPAYLGQHVANARDSAEKGIQPPLFVYDYVLSDARGVITGYPFAGEGDSPLMEDIRGKVAVLASNSNIPEEEAESLTTRAAEAIKS